MVNQGQSLNPVVAHLLQHCLERVRAAKHTIA
jgi:hypothetical protein